MVPKSSRLVPPVTSPLEAAHSEPTLSVRVSLLTVALSSQPEPKMAASWTRMDMPMPDSKVLT